jgi:phage FluMu protein Com
MAQGIVAAEGSKVCCAKCGKTMALTQFYTYKDGSKCELCKACLTMHINTYEPETFM